MSVVVLEVKKPGMCISQLKPQFNNELRMARCQLGEAQIHFYELCFYGLLCHHRLPAVETPTLHMSVPVRLN